MMEIAANLQASVKRLLALYPNESRPYVGGLNDTEAGRIDDGDYGDPLADTRPAFVKEDERGWRRVVSLKR